MKKQSRLWIAIIVLVIASLACNALGGTEEPTAEPAPTDVPVEAPTDAPDPDTGDTGDTSDTGDTDNTDTGTSGAVSSFEDVQSATIRIVATGTFVDPQVGLQLNAAGSGSGFIISEDGIAVTNNHVVTGAATLEVYVGGEDTPRNARVLGASECSDLAVIDIEGEGYSYLDWYEGSINVGLDIYAAGFPLGDPEFTLTRGIVSKASADGNTSWASVDSVIEHDARINPGNSGGPLVDTNGRVVGVNYAGVQDIDHFFAISRDEAQSLVAQLQNGDVTSIGINGTAIAAPDVGIYGIWVSSVKSGSPADNARIEPGDIITRLQDIVLSTDGTMSDYCSILNSHAPTDTMNVEVLRFSTEEVLEGQLNGRELETTVSFGTMLDDEVADAPADTSDGSSGPAFYEYELIFDDSGTLSVEVPTAWADRNGSPWSRDGETVGWAVSAAPNRDDFLNTWTTPGVFFAASTELAANFNEVTLLDTFDFSGGCDYEGRFDYSDPLYTGVYDLYSDCGGEGVVEIVLTAVPENRNFVILVVIQVVTDADLDALDNILNTFFVDV